MNLQNVVEQLRTFAPALGTRVAGVADYAVGLEEVANLPMPAAFVYPLSDEAAESEDLNGLYQRVTERFAVTVQFDNTIGNGADSRTGFTGVNQVYDMRAAVFRAILNWLPPDQVGKASRGIMYDGAELLDFDRARLFWQFDFRIETLITDADGFIPDYPPLTDIEMHVTNPETGATTLTVDIPIDQTETE